MARVNYILGAGASAKAVPVVIEINAAIQNVIDEINHPDFKKLVAEYGKLDIPTVQALRNLEEELVWMMSMEKEHATIDTYAKKLSIRRDYRTLNRLKIVFSLFLSVHQANTRIDNRYDYFLAALLEDNAQFTNDVNIVSWNYDNQLELAYSEYAQVNSLSECASELKMVLKNMDEKKINAQGFNFLKVNGSTSVFDNIRSRSYYFLPKLKYESPGELWYDALQMFIALKKENTNRSALSFAWERYGATKEYFAKVSETFLNTEVLVIIGYSFPFFNRIIDREILSKANNLKRVYIQDLRPNDIVDKLIETLPEFSVSRNNIRLIDRTNEFFIPHEL